MLPVVARFKRTFVGPNKPSAALLSGLYRDDVRFQDPFRQIAGLPALTSYLGLLYAQVESCTFTFEEDVVQDHRAALAWTMSLTHPRLNGGETVTIPGSTLIRFHDKVFFHRDYFDAGAMLYEQLPLIGMVIRIIKSRV